VTGTLAVLGPALAEIDLAGAAVVGAAALAGSLRVSEETRASTSACESNWSAIGFSCYQVHLCFLY
jgi:hypothetical protein